jgi:hypothetical protein
MSGQHGDGGIAHASPSLRTSISNLNNSFSNVPAGTSPHGPSVDHSSERVTGQARITTMHVTTRGASAPSHSRSLAQQQRQHCQLVMKRRRINIETQTYALGLGAASPAEAIAISSQRLTSPAWLCT